MIDPKTNKHISYLDCPHRNQQTYTEYCLDCGYNVWTTDQEYLASLQEEIRKTKAAMREHDPIVKSIRAAEKQLNELKATEKATKPAQ